MADSVAGSSLSQIQSSYEKYKDYFTDDASTALDQTDFLALMVEQLSNQDFNNPTDNSEFIAQMAQFSALQSQQQMTQYAQATYATSLVGKNVSYISTNSSGVSAVSQGVVSSVKIINNEYTFVINGKNYTSAQITAINATTSSSDTAGTVSAAMNVDLSKVDGLSTTFSGTPTVTIQFSGKQSTPITLGLSDGASDAVTGYAVDSTSTILGIQLENMASITSTSDLVNRINKAIAAEIASPTNAAKPDMTTTNFTAGNISIKLDTSGVTRTDKTNFTEDDIKNINKAAAKTITATNSILLK